MKFAAVSAAALALFVGGASAHVFRLDPSAHRAAPGDEVKVMFRVGDEFPGEVSVRRDARIVMLRALGPSGEADIPGIDGMDPAGTITLSEPGVYVLAYTNTPLRHEMEAAKFEDYLREEGLEAIVERRAAAGQTAQPGRELYSRCAKALVKVGQGASTGFDRVVGMPMEIVPESDPFVARPGDELAFRVWFDGKPAPGVLIEALNEAGTHTHVEARTDDQGRVRMRLEAPGRWAVAGVHMTQAPNDSGADWQSVWASLTFDLAKPPQ